jgi:hypothetical protein
MKRREFLATGIGQSHNRTASSRRCPPTRCARLADGIEMLVVLKRKRLFHPPNLEP